MDWFAALVTRANGNGTLTTLLGGSKVYPENAPQVTPPVTRPYITILDLTAGRPELFTSYDIEPSRVQVDVWANSYKSKNAIMEAFLAAVVPGGTFNGHKFQRAIIDLGPRDIPERDGETIIYRKSADLIIHHTTA